MGGLGSGEWTRPEPWGVREMLTIKGGGGDTSVSVSEGHRGRFSPETERMIEATSQRAELRRLAQATYNAKMLFERIMMDAYLFAGANPRMMV